MWQLLIGPVADLVNTVLKRVLPAEVMSEEARAKLQAEITLELSKQDWQAVMAQTDINKEEAKSTNWFVAGWRPACGWVGATALAWHYVIEPLLAWVLVVVFHYSMGANLPKFDMDSLMTILLGMLGIGGMRTMEKIRGVSETR